MKKIYTCLCLILGITALTASVKPSEIEPKPSHHYPYVGAVAGNITPTSLMIGYRWIQDGLGIDVHATAFYLKPVGNYKSFSLSPTILYYADEAHYGGIGASLVYNHLKGQGMSTDESYQFYPHVTVGKEMTVLDGKKIFTNIQYAPFVASDSEYTEGWFHKIEFKTGIGF